MSMDDTRLNTPYLSETGDWLLGEKDIENDMRNDLQRIWAVWDAYVCFPFGNHDKVCNKKGLRYFCQMRTDKIL